jgi:TrmH RNA methyltransferase
MPLVPPREQTLCGLRAVQAALRQRPEQVRRLYFAAEYAWQLAPVLADLATRRAIFRQLPADELDRVAGTRAHQGLVAVLEAPEVPILPRLAVEQAAREAGVTLLLDGVGNPHNIGAIARTAAFLGVRALWLTREGAETVRSSAACRTAEGGLEHLPVAACHDALTVVRAFVNAGGQVLALSVRGDKTLADLTVWRGKAVLLVLGSEEDGLHPAVEAACSLRVRIAGTGAVESLNVSVAAGIALAALCA